MHRSATVRQTRTIVATCISRLEACLGRGILPGKPEPANEF